MGKYILLSASKLLAVNHKIIVIFGMQWFMVFFLIAFEIEIITVNTVSSFPSCLI